MTAQHRSRHPALEIFLVLSLLAAFLWLGRDLIVASIAFGTAVLGVTCASQRRAGESARDIGWRLDTLCMAGVYLLPVVLVAAAILGLAAHRLQSGLPVDWFDHRNLSQLPSSLLSGTLQQYLLLGFLYRRCAEWLRNAAWATLATTSAFAALHVPNVFLVAISFPAGALSCAIYRRAPNLFAAGVAHGLIIHLLANALPPNVTGGMHVGIDYLRWLTSAS